MKIIARYILKEILKYFSMVLFTVVVIYLVVDFIEKIDNFMEAGVRFPWVLKFFILKIPSILTQIIPLAALLAVLITLGLMARNNELTALRAGGFSLSPLIAPVVKFGAWGFLTVLVLAEVVTPLTNVGANRIWFEKVKQRPAATSRQDDIWIQAQQSILHLKYYQPETQTAMGVTLYRFNPQFLLIERIEAKTAVAQNKRWLLTQGLQQVLDADTRQFDIHAFDRLEIDLNLVAEDLANAAPDAEEMSFLQLYRYVKKIKREGYNAIQYEVDLNAKIAFPFACIIMALVGAGLTLSGKIKEGLPLSISCGIGIAFVYWIALSFCISLGYAEILPPWLAVWTVNWIWLCLAGFLLIHANQ